MEHLPLGVRDEEGCFVYRDITEDGLAVRSDIKVGDECRTNFATNTGDLVSVDMIRYSRFKGSINGPFLRLSDASGWLFEKKFGEQMMERVPVKVGLWSFYVENSVGIALRRHPTDRSSVKIKGVCYKFMQRITCDRRVKHPSTGVNYYRVQGTEGWVFDKRGEDLMLIEEAMVMEGLFVYQALHPLGIRDNCSVDEGSKTSRSVSKGEMVAANLIRQSPYRHGNGPFLRLSNGSGWLFENKENMKMMVEKEVEEGEWKLQIVNRVGLGVRDQPNHADFKEGDVMFQFNTIVDCDLRVKASSGTNFYRVKGVLNGWIFDRRNDKITAKDVSDGYCLQVKQFQNSSKPWTPDYVRGIASTVEGLKEIAFNPTSRLISFLANGPTRINVYYTTRTVGTALNHPNQGSTQLFRRHCSDNDLLEIFRNPRTHTGKGYKRKRNDPGVVSTQYGEGIIFDNHEDELRNEILEIDDEIRQLQEKRRNKLSTLRDKDLDCAKAAASFETKVETWRKFDQARKEEAERVARAQKQEAERVARAQKQEAERRARLLSARTCQVCGREFVDQHAKEQHYYSVHEVWCDYCGKSFSNLHALRQHQDALDHY